MYFARPWGFLALLVFTLVFNSACTQAVDFEDGGVSAFNNIPPGENPAQPIPPGEDPANPIPEDPVDPPQDPVDPPGSDDPVDPPDSDDPVLPPSDPVTPPDSDDPPGSDDPVDPPGSDDPPQDPVDPPDSDDPSDDPVDPPQDPVDPPDDDDSSDDPVDPPQDPPVGDNPVDPPSDDDDVSRPPVFVEETEEFDQIQTLGKIDILFVIDNSASMYTDHRRQRLAKKFQGLIDELQGLDYQIAATGSDVVRDTEDRGFGGRLDWAHYPSREYFLTPSSPNLEQRFIDLLHRQESIWCREKRGHIPYSCPTIHEQPLQTIIQALDRRRSDNRGFFRDDADLVVVTASDEDEKSLLPAPPTTAQDVLSEFQSIFPQKNLFVYGVMIEPDDRDCRRQQRRQELFGQAGDYGLAVTELAQLTQGRTINLCQSNYVQDLKDIGEKAKQPLLIVYTLQHDPIPGTVQVNLNPVQNIGYQIVGREIRFDRAPSVGTHITVTYDRVR